VFSDHLVSLTFSLGFVDFFLRTSPSLYYAHTSTKILKMF